MIRALIVAMAVSITAAKADPLCADIRGLAQMARTNFQGIETPPGLADADRCTFSLGLGGVRRLTCQWELPYRAPSATAKLADLDRTIGTCLGGVSPDRAAGVNHPDTFDQRAYRGTDVQISLALKDKVNLFKTFIFLAIAGRRR